MIERVEWVRHWKQVLTAKQTFNHDARKRTGLLDSGDVTVTTGLGFGRYCGPDGVDPGEYGPSLVVQLWVAEPLVG